MVNKKALLLFLGLTFGLTIGLLITARQLGFTLVDKPLLSSQMFVLAAMFVPGFSAIVTQKFIVKKPLKELGFVWGPWRMYVKTYSLIVMLFVINYTITWLWVMQPDFSLMSFVRQYNISSALPLPAPLMLTLLAGVTFFIAPIMNIIPSIGEEIGWRGFLLPNLEPLGKNKAMIYSSMIWAAWHTPMILLLGFMYGEDVWWGVLLHFMLVTGLGIWMGYVWLQTRSTVLAAFMHATFNANSYGVWAIVFVTQSKLIVGAGGIIGVSLCVLLGAITLYLDGGRSKECNCLRKGEECCGGKAVSIQ
jgi:membrane protease YdiL (CAAX protease family)